MMMMDVYISVNILSLIFFFSQFYDYNLFESRTWIYDEMRSMSRMHTHIHTEKHHAFTHQIQMHRHIHTAKLMSAWIKM